MEVCIETAVKMIAIVSRMTLKVTMVVIYLL